QAQRVPGILGTIQGPNLYHVRMDDPIAPEDEPALREALADLEMERRFGALLADEYSPAAQLLAELQPLPQTERQTESQIEKQAAAQPETKLDSQAETRAAPPGATQVTPLRRRSSATRADAQPPEPEFRPGRPNASPINVDQHKLNNVPNVGRQAP